MNPDVVSRFISRFILLLSAVAIGAVALSCGSITSATDSGSPGAAGSGGGGATGSGGTAGTSAGSDAGPLACHVDLNDCPTGFTCACGGPGPGMCTCHRSCTDANQCGAAEPMCGCPSTTGGARFCVNACFCSCQ